MPKVKALSNAGAEGAFRMLRKDKEIDLPIERVNAGVIRLWKKGVILIDGKEYSPSSEFVPVEEKTSPKTTVVAVKDEEVKEEALVERVENPDISDPIEDEVKVDEKAEEEVPVKEEAQPETENQTEEQADESSDSDENKEEEKEDDSEEKEDDSEEKEDDSEEKEDDSEEKESSEDEKVDSISEYVLSKNPGFFTPENLRKRSLASIKQIGSNMGIDVKRKKSGVDAIVSKVEEILAQ